MVTIEACLSFLEPWPSAGEQNSPYLRGVVEDGYPATNFKNEDRIVQFKDARSIKDQFTLDQHGFTWMDSAALPGHVLDAIRSKEKGQVTDTYYPLVEKLLKDTLGASRVIIFDHTYRKRDPSVNLKENPYKAGQPATVVS
jgi:hypothetical protein